MHLMGEGQAVGGERKHRILVNKEICLNLDSKTFALKHPACPQQAVKGSEGKTAGEAVLRCVLDVADFQDKSLKRKPN